MTNQLHENNIRKYETQCDNTLLKIEKYIKKFENNSDDVILNMCIRIKNILHDDDYIPGKKTPAEKLSSIHDIIKDASKHCTHEDSAFKKFIAGLIHCLTFGYVKYADRLNHAGLFGKTKTGHIFEKIEKISKQKRIACVALHHFDTKKGVNTGGNTGSRRVQSHNQIRVQLKPSILENPSQFRRWKAKNTDRENFAELIASHIGRALTEINHVPNVFFVYDNKRKKISIGSQYLQGTEVRTLDEYAIEKGKKITAKKHIVCIAGDNEKADTLALDGDNLSALKQSLTDKIVLSAILGDHDINPGNMMVITSDNQSHIARIDFGHAFNDLLNAPKLLGGQLLDKQNPVLDFFNRDRVAGGQSKLWRDYPGLVPSQEIVNALNTFSQKIREVGIGIQNARQDFDLLIEGLYEDNDLEGIIHVEKSLKAIYDNISGKTLEITNQSTAEILDTVFNAIQQFVLKNCQNAKLTANVMQLQLDIDRAIINDYALPSIEDIELPQKDAKIQWVKTSTTTPVFSGSFEAYVEERQNALEDVSPFIVLN